MKRGSRFLIWIFLIYLAVLIAVVVFKVGTDSVSDRTDRMVDTPETAVNLKPLNTLRRYWRVRHEIDFRTAAMRNLAGNIIPFLPLGVFLPWIWRDKRAFMFTLIAALDIILLIELSQLVFRRGIFDVDDILLNTVGVIIGFLGYGLIYALRSRSPRKE